jgi:hypothetical protein
MHGFPGKSKRRMDTQFCAVVQGKGTRDLVRPGHVQRSGCAGDFGVEAKPPARSGSTFDALGHNGPQLKLSGAPLKTGSGAPTATSPRNKKETKTATSSSWLQKLVASALWDDQRELSGHPHAVITSGQSGDSYGPRSQFGVRVTLLDDSVPVSASMLGTFFQAARPTFRASHQESRPVASIFLRGHLAGCSRLRPGRRSERTPCSSRSQETRRSSSPGNCGAARGRGRSKPQDAHEANSKGRGLSVGPGDDYRSHEPAGDRPGEREF